MPVPTHRARDLAALAAVVAAILVLVRPDLDPRGPRTIWVSTAGSDWRSGRSPDAAVATLQRAADMVRPGDEVVVLPGVYRERVRIRRGGEPGRPVTFRAAEPGTVTISGEAEPATVEALEWRDEGGGVFSAATPWPVHWLRVGRRHAYHVRWGGAERLRSLVSRPAAWDAFLYDREAGRLWLHVRGGAPPSGEEIAVNDPIPWPREWGNVRAANVWVEADHVTLQGMRFVGGVRAGVLLWSARGTVIRDCFFEGADYGVASRPRTEPPSPLTVETSLYHNYPQRSWRDAWLSWEDVYAHYPSSSLVASEEDGVRVSGNLVAHSGDALRITNGGNGSEGVEIRGNLIVGGTDDAIEFDGPARRMRFVGNLVYDVHESLGLSPVLEGPVVVRGNLFLHPADGVNGAQLKLLNPAFDRGDTTSTIRNVEVRENTFVGNWLAWWGAPPVEDVAVVGNVLAVQRMTDPPFHPGVRADSNRIVTLPTGGYPNPGTDPRWWPPGTSGGSWRMERPGPSWFDWGDHPATAAIETVLAPELVGG